MLRRLLDQCRSDIDEDDDVMPDVRITSPDGDTLMVPFGAVIHDESLALGGYSRLEIGAAIEDLKTIELPDGTRIEPVTD